MTKRQKSLPLVKSEVGPPLDPTGSDTPELMLEMGFLSVKDLTGKLKVQRLAVYRLIKRLNVMTTRIGNKQYVNMADLQTKIITAPPRRKPRPRKEQQATTE